MPKILFIAHYLYPIIGGGETSVLNLLAYLAKNGFECYGLCFKAHHAKFQTKKKLDYNGIHIFQENDDTITNVKRHIDTIKPDIVLSQSYGSEDYLELAKGLGIKTMLWIHFYNGIVDANGGPYVDVLKNKHKYKTDTKYLKAFNNADKIIVNSDFMYRIVKEYTQRAADNIIYPIISHNKDVLAKKENNIMFVNPCLGKGLKLVYGLALTLKEYNFLVVGKFVDFEPENVYTYMKTSSLPNVKSINRNVNDMSEFYNKTRLLVVPSGVDETFNMVTVEAFMHGIPAIVSQHGNLPFLVKDGAGYCEDIGDFDAWKNRVKSLMENKEQYNECISAIDKTIENYGPEQQCKKFVNIIEELLKK